MTATNTTDPKSATPPPPADTGGHMQQLDAWRAVAVIGVLIQHFFPLSLKIAPTGYIGVRLFFVLSGFLITGILLRCRQLSASGQPLMTTIRQFYIRRFLRIFPVYYLCLGLALMAGVLKLGAQGEGVQGLRESIWWHVAYLSNFYFAKIQNWGGIFFHFWSLSVEEQFYLAWPWVILMLPRRALMPTVLATILAGLAWKFYAYVAHINFFTAYCLPMGAWDALGAGALLALLRERSPGIGSEFKRLWQTLLYLGLALVALGIALRLQESWHYEPLREGVVETDMKKIERWMSLARIGLTMDIGALMLSIWAVRGSAIGFKGVGAVILRQRPLLYLGLISYGLYIYHPFMITVVKWLSKRAGIHLPTLVAFLVMSALAVAWSAASWHLFESPINNYKRFFPYKKRR